MGDVNTCATCADRLVNGRPDRDPMHCRTCHAEWTGLEAQHCLGSGVIHATWRPSAVTGAHGDAGLDQRPEDGARAEPESFTNALCSHPRFIELHRAVHIDPTVVLNGMSLWRHDLEIARIVVGLVSVPVADVLVGSGPRHNPVFVGLDDLVRQNPSEADIAVLAAVTVRRDARLRFAWTQAAQRPLIGPMTGSFAGVAPSPLASRSRYRNSAVDTSDLPHTVIVQWFCHHTFVGIGAADSHHREPLVGSDDRRMNPAYCIDPATTAGWREKRPGVWTDADRWDGLT